MDAFERYIIEVGSTKTFTPECCTTVSNSRGAGSMAMPYCMPEQPPPLTNTRSPLYPWGNCFSPAICLDVNKNFKPFNYKGKVRYPALLTLTLRSSHSLETTIHWRGGFRFNWNSAHLARRFGQFVDTDFGGYNQWRGHMDM